MGILIIIRKLLKQDNVHYYTVYNQNKTIAFYMAIDSFNQRILFFLDNELKNPTKIVDFTNKDEIIIPLQGVDRVTFTKALVQALKALDKNSYPDILDLVA